MITFQIQNLSVMKIKLVLLYVFLLGGLLSAQNMKPTDYLSAEFHKSRREALRQKMPENSVAVFFANPVRNRANDVEYIYHQDPNFYYLSGYREPHAVLLIFSEYQTDNNGNTFNEMLYVQEKNPRMEQWTGERLGVEGAKQQLQFEMVFNGKDFLNNGIDFMKFDQVLFKDFFDDYRNTSDTADLYDLIASFKNQVGYHVDMATQTENSNIELKQQGVIAQRANINTKSILTYMASLREIKTEEELVLLKKAIRISAQGQREVMKAMKPNLSETEIQGIHEFVYKKYGSEYEGYPSIVGAGNNGCVLHYIENSKTSVEGDLVLMDLGAEYRGYTADVTRTIPSSGKFNTEQKLIYDLVYEAQEAGIATCVIGNSFSSPDRAAREVITQGLIKLGIVKNAREARIYFPHGTSHHIGLDVHDPGLYQNFEENMVLTVEPGIYIPIGSDCDEKWWGIAVRIEDDILITKNGPVNLSADAPRKSDEIEALMKEKSVLDGFLLPNLDD